MSDDTTLKDCERQRVECYTRVMGYFRPKQAFNVGKKQEMADRKLFVEVKEKPE